MAAPMFATPRSPRMGLLSLLAALACAIGLPQTPAQAEGVRAVPTLRYAVEEIEPAVVSILAYHADGSASQGTGFLVRADGLVITSDHVVRGARSMEITWSSRLDRPAEQATLVRSDRNLDIALLQLPGYNYPTLGLAEPSEVRVGDAVAALGYPAGDILGLADLSVTRGIISALRRDDLGEVELVQTDARIAVGNSGGPLYDLELGAVVGVVRAKGLEELDGINFAVALSALVELFPEIQEDTYGQLTASVAPVVNTVDPSVIGGADSLKRPLRFEHLDGYVGNAASPSVRPSAADLDLLVQEYPDYAQAHYLRGRAAMSNGDFATAQESFKRAFDLYPRDLWSAYYLGALAAQSGDTGTAFEWLSKSLAVGFNDFQRLPNDPLYAPIQNDPNYKKLYDGHI